MKEFPADVDIPTRVDPYERAAMMIANMSSWPGSQSSHILLLISMFICKRYISLFGFDSFLYILEGYDGN